MKISIEDIIVELLDRTDVAKKILAPGEFIFEMSYNRGFFIGRCELCDSIVASEEWWYEDSDHCIECENRMVEIAEQNAMEENGS